jgi:bifunctional non-homologous end joining protein LigD
MISLFPLMEPNLVQQVPDDPSFIYQVKYDGIRILCSVTPESIELYTKKQNERTKQYPEFFHIRPQLKANSCILDGEVIVRSDVGKPQFSFVVRRDRSSREEKVKQLIKELPIEYHVFDILMKDGADLRHRPFSERTAILNETCISCDWLQLVESHHDGRQLYRQMAEKDWEGVVAKRIHSPYASGKKHPHWFKIKIMKQLLCVVGGIQYKSGFPNSLLIGAYAGEHLHFVGKISSGLTAADTHLLHSYITELEQEESPFMVSPAGALPVRWVEPRLTLLAEYMEMTEEGILRHPKIIGFTQSSPKEARLDLG